MKSYEYYPASRSLCSSRKDLEKFQTPKLFRVGYLIQTSNIANAATALYSTFVLCCIPKEVLIYGFGISMFLHPPKDKIKKDL